MNRLHGLSCALLTFSCTGFASTEHQKPPNLEHPEVLSPTQSKTFENTSDRCRQNATCDLKQIIFRKRDFISSPDETGYTMAGSELFAGFVTSDVDVLSKYVFVQFARGCMWDSYLNEDGTTLTEFGVLRNFHGFRRIQHVLPIWTVDSNDSDPVYGSDGNSGNRQFYLQTADEVPSGIPRSRGRLLGEAPATIPFGYVTDLPGPATYSPSLAWSKNMSLEYKMCLFRTEDVPRSVSQTDYLLAKKAIDCFEWESKFVYDHDASAFRGHSGIHAECRRPFTEFEKKFHLRQLETGIEKNPQ